MSEPPPRLQVELPAEAIVKAADAEPVDAPGTEDDRPDYPNRDSTLKVLRRLEDGLGMIRLLLSGLFLFTVVTAACLIFIIVFSLTHR